MLLGSDLQFTENVPPLCFFKSARLITHSVLNILVRYLESAVLVSLTPCTIAHLISGIFLLISFQKNFKFGRKLKFHLFASSVNRSCNLICEETRCAFLRQETWKQKRPLSKKPQDEEHNINYMVCIFLYHVCAVSTYIMLGQHAWLKVLEKRVTPSPFPTPPYFFVILWESPRARGPLRLLRQSGSGSPASQGGRPWGQNHCFTSFFSRPIWAGPSADRYQKISHTKNLQRNLLMCN